jgi:tetratricopeptide (TPR) repeat protein
LSTTPRRRISTRTQSYSTERARGQYRQALPLQEQALELSQRLRGNDHPDPLAMMVNLALARWFLGDSHGARELEEQALAGYRRVLGDDHPSTLRAMDNLAAVRRELGEL